MEEYSDFSDQSVFYDIEYERSESTFYQTYKYCLKPTLFEVLPHIWKLLLINFIFRLGTQTSLFPKLFCHIFSALCGVALLYFTLQSSVIYITVFIVFCYVTLVTTKYFIFSWNYLASFLCIIYLIVSEFKFPLRESWSETRGIHMIVAMKMISLAHDFKKGTLTFIPNPIEFAGFIFCPSTCVFGPWVSFSTYLSVFNGNSPLMDLGWIKRLMISVSLAIFLLGLSNCWAYWLIPQTWRWFVAYQEALSFRSSHYFISYLSESAMIAGGFGYEGGKKNQKTSTWRYVVTNPIAMEFPRSLVQVVVHWNIPMHMWLKTYVFQVCKPLGSFFAVIVTYLVSSFLHGFNLRLAAVLLSLGFYTYIEHKLRFKLASIFDACILANPCKKCTHLHRDHLYVWLVNAVFSAIAIFHLAYLGCLLESTSADTFENESELFLKWQNLDYSSHMFTAFLYVIYKLI